MRRNVTFRALLKQDYLYDYDNNRYKSRIIGDNEWIDRNYKTTHYADGTLIENIPDIVTTNLLTGWTNANFNVFTFSGSEILSASHGSISNGQVYTNMVSLVAGDVLIFDINLILLTGTLPKIILANLWDIIERRDLVEGPNRLVFNITNDLMLAYIVIENQSHAVTFAAPTSGLYKTTDKGFIENTDGAYCWYDNIFTNKFPYGALYNYPAIENEHGFVYLKRNNIIEEGWRVPTIYDWDNLLNQVGGYLTAGSLKETGTTLTPAGHWTTPNTGAANERKMRIIGTGSRLTTLGFNNIYKLSSFWSTTPYDISPLGSILTKKFVYDNIEVSQEEQNRNNGLSVRLVRGFINAVKYFALYNWYAVNKGIIVPPPVHEYGALYNWYAASAKDYGALYNWYAINTGKLAPTGWHVPSETEFNSIITSIGGASVAGGYAKESGYTYWNSPNTGADNSSGFNGRGSGYRRVDHPYEGVFMEKNVRAIYGTTKKYTTSSESKGLASYNDDFDTNYSTLGTGISIRCINNSTSLSNGQTSTVTDIDGNTYTTKCYGSLEIMTENLKVTNYNDGTPISIITDGEDWAADTAGAMCYYDNDINNARTIAPTGWHVPTMIEWLTLFYEIDAVNGPAVAGGPLKEIGTTHWNSPNTGATDDYNFTTLPGGYREPLFGDFIEKLNIGIFWIDETDPLNDVAVSMHYDSLDVKYWAFEYNNGVSIRCILDGVNPTDPGTVTDIDGNVYLTVKIGTQVWMAENLKVTKYNDGTDIPLIENDTDWINDTSGAYCWYNNE
jgi:uncharacterized protein (TIGR02145 family)